MEWITWWKEVFLTERSRFGETVERVFGWNASDHDCSAYDRENGYKTSSIIVAPNGGIFWFYGK